MANPVALVSPPFAPATTEAPDGRKVENGTVGERRPAGRGREGTIYLSVEGYLWTENDDSRGGTASRNMKGIRGSRPARKIVKREGTRPFLTKKRRKKHPFIWQRRPRR